TRANRNVSSSLFERPNDAVVRPAAFRENQQRNEAFLHGLRGRLHCFDGSSRIVARHGNVAGLAQVSDQKRNFEQAALGEKTKLDWDAGQYYGRVHVARVIRRKYITTSRVDMLQPFDGDLH